MDSTVVRPLQKHCFDSQSQAPAVGEPNGTGAPATAESNVGASAPCEASAFC